MNLVERVIPYSGRGDKFSLWLVGDVHVGNVGWHKEGFERCINDIKRDPHALVLLMGDLAECIVPGDKRFDAKTVHPDFIHRIQDLADAQYEYLEQTLKPIADKIVGILTGNHEETIRLRWYRDLTLDLSRRLSAPYIGYSGAISLKFQRKKRSPRAKGAEWTRRFIIYAHHGRGGGRGEGSQINTVTKFSEGASADLYVMGHVHGLSSAVRSRMHFNFDAHPPRIEDRPQIFAVTGSFLKGYIEGITTYSERAGYHPNALGCAKVNIVPFDRKLGVERVVI